MAKYAVYTMTTTMTDTYTVYGYDFAYNRPKSREK